MKNKNSIQFALLFIAVSTNFNHLHAAELKNLSAVSFDNVAFSHLNERLKLDKGITLQRKITLPTAKGTSSVKVQQLFQGVPIYGHHLVVELDKQDNVVKITGDVVNGIINDIPSVKPELSGDEVAKLLNKKLSKSNEVNEIKDLHSDLYIYLNPSNKADLIYRISYFNDKKELLSNPTALINANTGKIIKFWDGIVNESNFNAKIIKEPQVTTNKSGLSDLKVKPGTLARLQVSGVGGNEKKGKYTVGLNAVRYLRPQMLNDYESNCFLIDMVRGIRTTKNAGADPYKFDCSSRAEDKYNGGYHPVNDIHYFSGVTVDMYLAYLNMKPLSIGIVSNVLYEKRANSLWNPRSLSITYYGGDEKRFPFTALDNAAHEISHGFTQQQSGLETDSGEGGGINESFSDMAGEAAKYYLSGGNNFLHGEDIIKPGAVQNDGRLMLALRYMCNPSRDGYSIDNLSDYHDQDVHYAAGIYNKAFCLLSKSRNWNTKSAFQVFSRANTLYWGQDTGFIEGACGVIHAASDEGYSAAPVISAFEQVGITCPTELPKEFTTVITKYGVQWPANVGFPQTAFSEAQFQLVLPATTYPIKWQSTAPSVATVSAGGKVTIHNPGQADIKAIVNGNTLVYSINPNIWFTIPEQTNTVSVSDAQAYCQTLGLSLPPMEQLTHTPLHAAFQPAIGALADEWGEFPITMQDDHWILSSSVVASKPLIMVFGIKNTTVVLNPRPDPKGNFVCSDKNSADYTKNHSN